MHTPFRRQPAGCVRMEHCATVANMLQSSNDDAAPVAPSIGGGEAAKAPASSCNALNLKGYR